MIGLLGGLGAAVSWAVAALTAARASRGIGAGPTLGWVMVIGLVAIAPTFAFADPGALQAGTVGWLAVAGVANVAGLALEYLALRAGPVGVVAPLCSTEGAIAAVIAAITGQMPSAATLATLAVILAGVVLSAAAQDGDGTPGGDGIAVGPGPPAATEDRLRSPGHRDHVARAAVLSMVAAVLFGLNLYALARAGSQASVVWGLWPARIVGTVAVALPLAARGRLKPPGRAWPFVVGSGLAEVTGILAYAAGARHGVAIPAVVASQFAGLAALGGYLLLGERIGRRQVIGLVTIGIGVAVLAALQASS